MEYRIIFNSGLSVEDTVSIKEEAISMEKALEIALIKNPEYSGWNRYIEIINKYKKNGKRTTKQRIIK